MSHYVWVRFMAPQEALVVVPSIVIAGSRWCLEIKGNPN